MHWDQLELPFVAPLEPSGSRSRHAPFDECPVCSSPLAPEHAHFRCTACGWRDSCCD